MEKKSEKIFLNTKKKKILGSIIVMGIFLISIGYIMGFKEVTIIDEGQELNFKTRKRTVEEVLEKREVSYIFEDDIKPTLDTEIEKGMEIHIKRAVNISILADEKIYKLLTPLEDVKAALKEAGLQLGQKDVIRPSLESKLRESMEIKITRALSCNIVADGKTIDLLTIAPKVKDAIKEANIILEGEDKISPGLEENIEKDLIIKITRVTEEKKTLEESIDFATIKQNVSSMYRGNSKVTRSGQKGVKELTYKVTYEDGKEVNRELLEEKTTKEPIDKIIQIGTKELPPLQVSRGGEVVRTLMVEATAYSPEDPGVGTRTSLGVQVRKGVIAVDPSVIPYRTKIYVPGYGYGEALDTGGAIKGNRIDVAFSTREEALKFGRQRGLVIKIYD